MARLSCLAGIDRGDITILRDVLKASGARARVVEARIDVAAIGQLQPDLLICDMDGVTPDGLETLRQLRFVLPECVIVVYTAVHKRQWSVACHMAGANGLLSKDSSGSELAFGLRDTRRSGCFTDPRFASAWSFR